MVSGNDLQRWVDAGLISSEAAEGIRAFEEERSGGSRVGRGMEAIAYLGAVLILVALGVLATEFWDEIEPWLRLVLSVSMALVLFVVGVVLGRSEEPAVDRAQTFAWFLTVASVFLTGDVALRELAELDGQVSFLWVAVLSFGAAVGLWWLRKSVLQMVAMGVTAGLTVIAAVSQFDEAPEWLMGLAFAGLGLVWLLLTWLGVWRPRRTSYVLASISILLIAFPESSQMPWPLLGLVSGLALMALSVRLDENSLLGLGVAGLFVYIPMSIFELFGETLGVPLALLLTGLFLLGVVVVSVRLRKSTQKPTRRVGGRRAESLR